MSPKFSKICVKIPSLDIHIVNISLSYVVESESRRQLNDVQENVIKGELNI